MTQKQFVVKKLNTDGYITRNFALRNYISRLGAIICDLKSEGWNIEGKNEDRDYIYEVKGNPFKKVIYKVQGIDKEIISYVI